MSPYCLFVQRPSDQHLVEDTEPMKVIECMECPFFVTYFEFLWTSNEMPEQQQNAFNECQRHAKRLHKAKGRIVRGWKA